MSAPLRTLVDGVDLQASWVIDRGLLYGDGLFETMGVQHGRVRFEAEHRARLAEGCRRLAIDADLDRIWIDTERAAAQCGEGTLRLQVTRGVATARGYTPTGAEMPVSILSVYPAPLAGELPPVLQVVTLAAQLGENPALAGLKHCNRLEQVLGRLELRSTGAFEGIMGSSAGILISGTMSNVFLELDGELVTPAVDRCGVAGVMRAVVLSTAARLGIAVRVAALSMAEASRCSALALSNARMGLVTAHALDGRALRRSAVLEQLAREVAR